ncbi:MAG: two-component regulator propeller domain-containing protein [Bacteroidota bacterium]|nr:hypothetical protein [Odoribacter sp.]MDP3643798.1 two-component regulator propeller domain-containing protein [Bacteroidota bacterium]
MKIFSHLLFTALLGILIFRSQAQPSVGEWTDYQSYARAKNVVDTGEKVYCVTEGGLFSYNKTDNSIQKMSGINGLSDVGIQRLAFSKENGILLIAYQNANVDLLIGNDIFNLSDIKRKQISADKTINNIMFSGNLAYLSCGFGIVVINLDKKEIKDTYFIGKDGGYLNVLDMATNGVFLFAATANGIYKASASEPNLQNYSNWLKQTSIPNADKKFSKIENFMGKIIANYTPVKFAEDELYELKGNIWSPTLPNIHYVSEMFAIGDYLVISSREEVFVFNNRLEQVYYIYKYVFPDFEARPIQTMCAVLDAQNIIWIADQKYGLIKVGTKAERIVPDGPSDNAVFSLTMNDQDLWITSGGRDNAWGNLWSEPKFQLNRQGKWSVFDRKVFPVPNDFKDMVCVAVDPKNPDHVFAGSWGGGVLEFSAGKFVKRYDNYNSTLQTQLPNLPEAPYVRIGGMDFDSKGNLWVTNSGVGKVISMFQTDGNWKSFDLSGIANKYSIGKVLVTKNDDKWIVVPRGHGLYVLSNTNTEQKEQRVVARFVNSEGEFFNEMNDVYAIIEDHNGEIWVGTSGGVAVFSNPKRIWTESVLYASRPGLDLKDGKFHPLLEKETVTSIAIDGANRKWFGTKTSGVFLISEDGETEIEHFTTENSPLPSNEINDIAINQQTGEVFFGTASGLISIMGEATAANDEFSDVYVYPNPVRETYDGPIVVKGLVDDTDVKITDISGSLVFKTTSLGGQAIWDGRNLNGNRCKTGVYLIFMTDPAGEKTKITKLLFIH